MSNTLKTALGGAEYAGIAAVSSILIALVSALILCYLWTSIRVRELLEESEGQTEQDIPQLVGLTVRDAKIVLGESTLKLETNGAGDDERIIGQTPAPGSTARRGSDVSIATSPPPTPSPPPN